MTQEAQHRFVHANGIRLHYVEAGQGFPVVLCHGFPELWYSWRYQIPALAAAGLRAIAPDLRGYGESDRPDEIEAYDIHHLVGDVVGSWTPWVWSGPSWWATTGAASSSGWWPPCTRSGWSGW